MSEISKNIMRDGEAELVKKIFEDTSLDVVVKEALRRGLKFEKLKIDRVINLNGKTWISTEKSTTPAAILYMEDYYKRKRNHLITQRPGDKTYGLFEYRWIP